MPIEFNRLTTQTFRYTASQKTERARMRTGIASYAWIDKLEQIGLVIMLASVPVNFILAFWNPDWVGLGVAIGFSLSLALNFLHFWCFYNVIKCPLCGRKPNKFKNGKNVPMKQAYAQLRHCLACRHCCKCGNNASHPLLDYWSPRWEGLHQADQALR